jgi:hypothetical protein
MSGPGQAELNEEVRLSQRADQGHVGLVCIRPLLMVPTGKSGRRRMWLLRVVEQGHSSAGVEKNSPGVGKTWLNFDTHWTLAGVGHILSYYHHCYTNF